jgi:hypothetical protein
MDDPLLSISGATVLPDLMWREIDKYQFEAGQTTKIDMRQY